MKLEEIHEEIAGVIYRMICREIEMGFPPNRSWESIELVLEDEFKEGGELHRFKFMEKDGYDYAKKYWEKNWTKIAKEQGYFDD